MAEKFAAVKRIAVIEASNILKDPRYASVSHAVDAVTQDAAEKFKDLKGMDMPNLRKKLREHVKAGLDQALAQKEQQKAAMEAASSKAKEFEYKLEWRAAATYYQTAYQSAPENQKPALEEKIREMARNCLLERKYQAAKEIYEQLYEQTKSEDLSAKIVNLTKRYNLEYIIERLNAGNYLTALYSIQLSGYMKQQPGEELDDKKTIAAIRELQGNLGVAQTGKLDYDTAVVLAKRIEADRDAVLVALERDLNIKPAEREAFLFINQKERDIKALRKEGDRRLELGLQRIAKARELIESDPDMAQRLANEAFTLAKFAKKKELG